MAELPDPIKGEHLLDGSVEIIQLDKRNEGEMKRPCKVCKFAKQC